MKCPKCYCEIKEQVLLRGVFFKRKEIYYYCPLCGFENKKEFKLSKEDFDIETQKKLNRKDDFVQRHIVEKN